MNMRKSLIFSVARVWFRGRDLHPTPALYYLVLACSAFIGYGLRPPMSLLSFQGDEPPLTILGTEVNLLAD